MELETLRRLALNAGWLVAIKARIYHPPIYPWRILEARREIQQDTKAVFLI